MGHGDVQELARASTKLGALQTVRLRTGTRAMWAST